MLPAVPLGSVSRETHRAIFGDRLGLVDAYVEFVARVGTERGLIGPRESERLWDRHVLNCAAVAPAVPTGASLADVGSGAGFPGVVLAIARPDLSVSLIEPLARRATFLREVIETIGLTGVEVVHSRAELQHGQLQVDMVTARAVASLGTLARWCLPLVPRGGALLALKGQRAAAELAAAAATLRSLRARSWQVEEFAVPGLDPATRVVRVVRGP